MHPVEVTKVLDTLHLTDESETRSESADEQLGRDSDEKFQVNAMLEALFEEQRAVLRDDIRRGYEQIAETTATHRVPVLPESSNDAQSSLLAIGLAILAAATISLSYLYYDSQSLLSEANEHIAQLADDLRNSVPADGPVTTVAATAAIGSGDAIEALEWGVSYSEDYAFSETALGDGRAALITELVRRLRLMNFTGTIALDVHVGRFCMILGPDGTMILPPAEHLLEQCQQLGRSEAESFSLGVQQSLPFANAMALASRDGDVRFEVVSHGAGQARVAYPSFTQGLTAGEWNEVAASN
ncbi:MAG: hypothetical protein ACJ0SL_04350, partial [Candidatus Rariloculaceae bacterium]